MGKVFLVGAGPGDPELLTIRAAKLLAAADVVLHDALVSDEIMRMINRRAIVIDVGKRKGTKLHTQDEINGLLVSYTRIHKIVVRLKGGDPSLFGRAGEEIEALTEAGADFEIVPGITSAMAGASAAKISLTDRRHTASVAFVTAQRRPGAQDVCWSSLVAAGSTLAIYMPGTEYSELCDRLLDAGLEPDTPCAVISAASRSTQRVLWTAISLLRSRPALPAPAIVIVGECARPAGEIDLPAADFRQFLSSSRTGSKLELEMEEVPTGL